MTEAPVADDTPLRKARGAFFTPAPIAEFITAWAIRSAADRVLDPSCGDAAFLVPAIERLRSLGAARPSAEGVEIDGPTAYEARNRVAAAGGTAGIRVSDFFDVEPVRECEAVIGNPPYIRYQGFKGAMRAPRGWRHFGRACRSPLWRPVGRPSSSTLRSSWCRAGVWDSSCRRSC